MVVSSFKNNEKQGLTFSRLAQEYRISQFHLQFFVTPGSTSHIAAAFDRTHDQDSGIHSMLMKLRQLLNVYHEMDDEAPRYPWPSPPTVKFTSEEFQKLRNCRYLRLTKSNIQSLQQLEKQKPI